MKLILLFSVFVCEFVFSVKVPSLTHYSGCTDHVLPSDAMSLIHCLGSVEGMLIASDNYTQITSNGSLSWSQWNLTGVVVWQGLLC